MDVEATWTLSFVGIVNKNRGKSSVFPLQQIVKF